MWNQVLDHVWIIFAEFFRQIVKPTKRSLASIKINETGTTTPVCNLTVVYQEGGGHKTLTVQKKNLIRYIKSMTKRSVVVLIGAPLVESVLCHQHHILAFSVIIFLFILITNRPVIPITDFDQRYHRYRSCNSLHLVCVSLSLPPPLALSLSIHRHPYLCIPPS